RLETEKKNTTKKQKLQHVPPVGPVDLPLSLLEMGCSGRFELITHPEGGRRVSALLHLLSTPLWALCAQRSDHRDALRLHGGKGVGSYGFFLL
uniref:Uncharacterized protein n=1 Tax=Kryptolebias marmoratus TaxID=37003 RepID=A0A3Q2ZK25_KRYMA